MNIDGTSPARAPRLHENGDVAARGRPGATQCANDRTITIQRQ